MLFRFALPVVNTYQDGILVKAPRRARAPRQHSAARRANVIRYEKRIGASREDPSKTGQRVREALESVRKGETLLREVHHRVKNNLQIVASLLAMQADATSNPFVKRALSDAINRISTIALIHAQLCEAPNVAYVDMRSFIQELVGNVRRTFSNSTTNITTSLDVDPLSLGLHLATPCGLLVSELVTNAFQHAFPHVDRGVITVRLVSDDRRIILTVLDNGRGLPADAEGPGSRGLGLHLVRLLATRQLRGRVSISRRGGTQFTVTFPLAARDQLSRSARSQRESKAP